jgi:hypothetical protein
MVFHTVEKPFPWRGKSRWFFSIPWKIRMIFFHTVENPRQPLNCEPLNCEPLNREP